jgi:hypothetical protein
MSMISICLKPVRTADFISISKQYVILTQRSNEAYSFLKPDALPPAQHNSSAAFNIDLLFLPEGFIGEDGRGKKAA